MKKHFKKYAALCAVLPCFLINSLSLTASAINVNLSDYGDVNDDGRSSVFDISLINDYISGTTTFTTRQKIYADLNADGVINSDDTNIIVDIYLGTNTESVTRSKLSWYSRYGNVPVTSRYGDVNFDGNISVFDIDIMQKHMNGTTLLSPRQCVYADLNANGYVDAGDIDMITYVILGSNQSIVQTNCDLWYHFYQPILATPGNVDQNQQVAVEDAVSILTYYAKRSASLSVNSKTFCGIAAGDVDYDGVISVEDAVQVLTYYAKKAAGLLADWK